MIKSTRKTPVTARSKGVVIAVAVQAGDEIQVGDALAFLDDIEQRDATRRLSRELEAALHDQKLNPVHATEDAALRALKLQLEQAQAALESRVIRAPTKGVVSDVRISAGQQIDIGEIAASVVDPDEQLQVLALIPGADRPQLAPGMRIRLQLSGYHYIYQDLVIEKISEVMGSNEAHLVLGSDAENLHIRGPVTVIRAKLPNSYFVVDDQKFRYHEGMIGTVEVSLRSERAIFAILPGLRSL